jgi:hypothetical protein
MRKKTSRSAERRGVALVEWQSSGDPEKRDPHFRLKNDDFTFRSFLGQA